MQPPEWRLGGPRSGVSLVSRRQQALGLRIRFDTWPEPFLAARFHSLCTPQLRFDDLAVVATRTVRNTLLSIVRWPVLASTRTIVWEVPTLMTKST